MDDSIIRSCLLFFLVTLDDENRVYSCCESALSSARKAQHKKELPRLQPLVVEEVTKVFYDSPRKTFGARRPLGLTSLPSEELRSDLKKLSQKVSKEQFVSFVWNEISRMPLSDIAEGLKVSEGTVEYRTQEVLKAWAQE